MELCQVSVQPLKHIGDRVNLLRRGSYSKIYKDYVQNKQNSIKNLKLYSYSYQASNILNETSLVNPPAVNDNSLTLTQTLGNLGDNLQNVPFTIGVADIIGFVLSATLGVYLYIQSKNVRDLQRNINMYIEKEKRDVQDLKQILSNIKQQSQEQKDIESKLRKEQIKIIGDSEDTVSQLENQITQLNRQTTQSSNQVQKYRGLIDESIQGQKKLQGHLMDIQDSSNTKEGQLSLLSQELQSSLAQAQKERGTLREMGQIATNVKQQFQDIKEQVGDVVIYNEDLQGDIMAHVLQLEEYLISKKNTQRELSDRDQDIQEQREFITQMEEETQRINQALQLLADRTHHYQNIVKQKQEQIEQQNERHKQDISNIKKQTESLDQQNLIINDSVKENVDQLKGLVGTANEISRSIQTQVKDNIKVQEASKKIKKENDQKVGYLKQVRRNNQQTAKDIKQIKEDISHKGGLLEQNQEQLQLKLENGSQLQSHLQKLQSQLESMQTKCQQSQERNFELYHEIEKLQTNQNMLMDQGNTKGRQTADELQSLITSYGQHQDQLVQTSVELHKKQEELEHMESNYNSLYSKYKKEQQNRYDYEQALEHLPQALHEMEVNCGNIFTTFRSVEEQLQQEQTKHKESNDLIDDLRDKLDDSQQSNQLATRANQPSTQ